MTVPAAGESPARAVLTNAGNLENKDLGLVRERDHTKPYFHVDEHGYIHGRVTAPTKKETIVGRLKGWGLQLLPQDNGSVQLFAFSFSDNNTWPQSTFTITDDNWYGQEHDLTAVFNGGYFQLYVDGEAGALRRRDTTNEIVSGPLTLVDNSMFCIGYNANPQNADNPEDFSGGMKDFSMYINKECLNDTGLAALETASSAESNKKETFNTALTTLLSGTAPDVTITGEPAKYDLTTKWELVGEDGTVTTMPEGSVFERYRDYKVTVDVRAIDGYRFNKPQGILRTGEGDENILTSTPEETEEEVLVQLCYIFRGEEHPKETLMEYLTGIADDLDIRVEDNTLVNKDKTEGSKKYTTAGWNAFVPVYNAAVEQSQEEKAWGEDNNAADFAAALINLQNAVKSADAVFAAGSKDYTDAAWSAFEAAYKAAKAAPANADAEALKRLTDALVKAQAALNGAVKTGDIKTVDGMQYRVTNAGSKTVMLVKGKDAKSVTVPAAITIRGASYNVTAIGDQAFMNCAKIQKVTIGANVTSIGKKAFFKCKKLKNVIFKGTKVKTLKGKAFAKTASKVKVKMPKKLKGKQRSTLLKKLKKAGMKVK